MDDVITTLVRALGLDCFQVTVHVLMFIAEV